MAKTLDPELHLFIIWDLAREKEAEIIADIAASFTICKVFEVHWSKKYFAKNMSRFYGEKLPPKSYKEDHVGTGPFLLVIVEDHEPEYNQHDTNRGPEVVNSRLFTSKAKHREWTGGGSRIHATNSVAETDHDLTLLLGLNSHDFLKKYPTKSKEPEVLKQDLVGVTGWKSLPELFYVLNNTMQYVVMRNFSVLPDNFYLDKHGDIDLLVSSYREASFIMNAKKVFEEDFRVHVSTKIAKQDVLFDLRHVGDEYYAENWQRDMLNTRVLERGSFYVPAKEQHLYMLLYHALMHKPSIADDYREQFAQIDPSFGSMTSQQLITKLARFMKKNRYVVTRPVDISVRFNETRATEVQAIIDGQHKLTLRRIVRYAKRKLS